MRPAILLATAALLSACAKPVPPKPPPPAPPKKAEVAVSPCDAPTSLAPPLAHPRWPTKAVAGPVTGVRFLGQNGPSGDLEALLSSRSGAQFDPAKIELDIRRLWSLGRFDDVAVEADLTNGDLTLVYLVAERPPTGRVIFDGWKELPREELDAASEVRSGTPFDPAAVTRTVARLRTAYMHAGYRFATLEPHALRGKVVDVCLRIAEGPKVTIESWVWKGAVGMKPERLFAASGAESRGMNEIGGVYREDVWERDQLILSALYYDQGYLTVKVGEPELEVSADKQHLAVTVAIEEGAVYRIGKLTFAGDRVTSDKGYLAALRSKPGDVFSRAALLADMDRIRAMHEAKGQKVEVSPETQLDTKSATVDLVVRLVRAK